jgi:hypothetical protein
VSRKSQADLRLEAEVAAAARSKQIYSDIWRAFSINRQKGKSYAYKHLLEDLTNFSSDLVPLIMSGKEHFQLIKEAESEISGEGGDSKDTLQELAAKWIRGEIELSKISLEKLQ